MGNIIKVTLTEEIIRFIKLFNIKSFSDNSIGIDTFELYPQSHLFDFMSLVLGLEEHKIKGTEENPMGAQFDEETMEKMIELDSYIVENLQYIEEIVHQFCDVGIKPGVYTCLGYNRIWKYKESTE